MVDLPHTLRSPISGDSWVVVAPMGTMWRVIDPKGAQRVFAPGRLRKPSVCHLCGERLPRGTWAFRQPDNSAFRMHRFCAGCVPWVPNQLFRSEVK